MAAFLPLRVPVALLSLEHRTLQLFDFCSADLVLHHLDGL